MKLAGGAGVDGEAMQPMSLEMQVRGHHLRFAEDNQGGIAAIG